MFSFNSREKKELLAGTLIFVLVALTIMKFDPIFLFSLAINFTENIDIILFIISLSLIIFPLWLFHELGHKFSAQYYGLSSEFHLYPNLAFFSLISVILPIQFIAPGAVHVRGYYLSDISARIAMAGPLINILLGGGFLALSAVLSGIMAGILSWVSYLSFNIAVFNLIPFSVLDGAKIYRWNPSVFLVIFSSSLILYLFHPHGIFGGI